MFAPMTNAFNQIFIYLQKKISYCFAIVAFSLQGAFFGAYYAFYFGQAMIPDFSIENHPQVTMVFLVATLLAAVGHSVQFGVLFPFGIAGSHKEIRYANQLIKKGKALRHLPTPDLEKLLYTIVQIPKINMVTALGYSSLILIAVSLSHFLNSHPLYELLYVMVGWVVAVFVYGGFSYIISDYFTGPKRVEIKKILSKRDVPVHKEFGLLSLKGKFIFLLILILLSLCVLAVFISFGESSFQRISIFISLTFLEILILVYLYFQSIHITLEQINKSATNLALGGSGSLPIISIDREFIKFAENFEYATKEVGRIRKNLQELVSEKTFELRSSLDHAERLKKQQDGDYFLTSLLIKPLSLNKTIGNNVKIDFLVKQKKTFSFHGRENEIGGDICIARSFTLRGRDFTFFLNADAMGKSLQGAGGILVLGAAVQSILERSIAVESVKLLYAERWLKNAYNELNHIFESFDCSMLVSLVMGLIDEATGLVYFVNADHPRSVLYRDEVTSFVSNKSPLHKLGTPSLQRELEISTLQMFPGDILILGSDGRDDIEFLSNDKNRNINHDESLFLSHVKEGKGDLELIYKSILDSGTLTDDLSLMRISFKENEKREKRTLRKESFELLKKAREKLNINDLDGARKLLESAFQLSPDNEEIHRALTRILFRLKDFQSANRLFGSYLETYPNDSDMIYLAAISFKNTNDFASAIDMAERIRLRNPGHLPNLILLTELYMLQENLTKAEKIFQTIQSLGKKSKRVQNLESLLLSKK